MKFDTTSMPQWDRYFVGSDRVLKKLAEIADQSTQMMPIKTPHTISRKSMKIAT